MSEETHIITHDIIERSIRTITQSRTGESALSNLAPGPQIVETEPHLTVGFSDADNSATLLLGSVRVAGLFLTYVMHLTIARMLQVQEYGVFSFALNLCLLLIYPLSLGFVNGATRFVPEYLARNDYGSLVGYLRALILVPPLSVSALSLLAVWFFALFPRPSQVTSSLIISVLACALVCTVVNGLIEVIRGFGRAPVAHFHNSVVWPASVIGLLMLVSRWRDLDAASVICIAAASYVLVLVLQAIEVRSILKKLPQRPVTMRFGVWLPITLPIMRHSLAVAVMSLIDLMVVGLMLSAQDFGIYSAVQRVVLIMAFVPSTVNALSIPAVAYRFYAGDTAGAESVLRRATRWAAISSVVLWIAVAAFGDLALGLFGSEYSAGYTAMLILGSAYAIRYTFGPNEILLATLGREKLVAWLAVIALVAGAMLCAFASQRWGIDGAAGGAAVMVLCFHVSLWQCVRRSLHLESCALLPAAADRR